MIGRVARSHGRGVAGALALFALAGALNGCGSSDALANRISGTTLTIYSSGPFEGLSSPAAEAVLQGERLALAIQGGRIGRYRIVLRVLDDATVQRGGWDPVQTTNVVRIAVTDPTTIGYLGDLDSGASAISIPPLNRAGVAQISPTSSAVGLTSDAPGASPGEPEKYYPTGLRTFARIIPSDAVQASVEVRLQQSMGCQKTFVLDDGEVDGADAAASFDIAAQAARLQVVGTASYLPHATTYASLATSVAQTGADCVLLAAAPENHAALITEQVAAALPRALLFGWAWLAQSSYTDPSEGGIPVTLDPRILITGAALGPPPYPAAARTFLADFGGDPEPWAVCGEEAMSLMLDAIARATHNGKRPALRSKVVQALFSTRDRRGLLGSYTIEPDGDTTLRRYGVYRIVDGGIERWTVIQG